MKRVLCSLLVVVMLIGCASAADLDRLVKVKSEFDVCGFTTGMHIDQVIDKLNKENIKYETEKGEEQNWCYTKLFFTMFDENSFYDVEMFISFINDYSILVKCRYPRLSRETMGVCAMSDINYVYKKGLRVFGELPDVLEEWVPKSAQSQYTNKGYAVYDMKYNLRYTWVTSKEVVESSFYYDEDDLQPENGYRLYIYVVNKPVYLMLSES